MEAPRLISAPGKGDRLVRRILSLISILVWLSPAMPVLSGEPSASAETPALPPPSRLGIGFSGTLPEFVIQVPDTKSEVSGEVVARLGMSWVRDWLADTPYE